MKFSDDELACHRRLSVYQPRFLKYVEENPECLKRSTFESPKHQNPLAPGRLQPWPFFIDQETSADLMRATCGIARLIREIPNFFFGNDPVKISRFYGVDPETADSISYLLTETDSLASTLGRGDFIRSSNGFKCLEFNMGGGVGGWQTTMWLERLLAAPMLKRFIEASGVEIRHYDTPDLALGHCVDQVLKSMDSDDGEVNLVIVGAQLPDSEIKRFEDHFNCIYHRTLAERGATFKGRIFIADYPQLVVDSRMLYCRGERVHGVVDRDPSLLGRGIIECLKEGNICSFNGPLELILLDKRNIAILSESLTSSNLPPEHAAIIESYVPWTRLVRPKESEYEAEPIFLPDFVNTHRERLVLKPCNQFRGRNVCIGRFHTQEVWTNCLREALGQGNWVVQEYVESEPYLLQHGDEGCSPHDVVWGPFLVGETYAGCYLRVLRKGLGGIAISDHGGEIGLVLEVLS